jgi:hypothetical protein
MWHMASVLPTAILASATSSGRYRLKRTIGNDLFSAFKFTERGKLCSIHRESFYFIVLITLRTSVNEEVLGCLFKECLNALTALRR